ncbi:MAG: carboxylesterase family protein, partial [Actinomycetota bacterium]
MSVRARLGIRYATAERFAPPEPVPFTDEATAGGAFGPSAPQTVGHALGGVVPGMRIEATDERSCLTLNVWSPAAPGPHPVLVWFHGGSFVIGGTAQPVYDGTRLAAEQSVVVVTANYRLGAFGFLDGREIGGVANCGVRDALAALVWVRDHIDRFGGDPDRIVAFGESAGGGLIL